MPSLRGEAPACLGLPKGLPPPQVQSKDGDRTYVLCRVGGRATPPSGALPSGPVPRGLTGSRAVLAAVLQQGLRSAHAAPGNTVAGVCALWRLGPVAGQGERRPIRAGRAGKQSFSRMPPSPSPGGPDHVYARHDN